jgi:glycine cleavage system aminomethyltransferase T
VSGRIIVDGRPLPFRDGDSLALAMLRAGLRPGADPGPLCLSGDCPNCLCAVDGVAYVRSGQPPARAGAVVVRQPAQGEPAVPSPGARLDVAVVHEHVEVIVVGGGPAGREAAAAARAEGRSVAVLDAGRDEEGVGLYEEPMVVVRTPAGTRHVHGDEVIIATGAIETMPVCPGSDLEGILTPRAAAVLEGHRLLPAGTLRVTLPEMVVRFDGADGRVGGVVVRGADGGERAVVCTAVVVDLGQQPRDALARQGAGLAVTVVGAAAEQCPLPPPPTEGVVCPCTGTTVADLESVWERGFREIELVKRATLACTGACQGAVCLPHVRSFVAAHGGEVPPPFTARPLSRQLTLEEAAAGQRFAPVRRTALDGEHRALGAQMERFGGWWRPWTYGDGVAEYWAVREAVSVMDVGTLGKLIVSGPDAVRFLELLYPCNVGDVAVGRMRYALLLNEAGYVVDDGLIMRLGERRFALTFTTGGAASVDPWLRDWAETFGCDVRIMDRTAAEGAINVTGPLAGELLRRVGVAEPPGYMGFVRAEAAGVPCRVLRLGFTGEASYELHHDADRSVALWRALLAAGADLGVRPHGLDALLTLRLEKGHVIVGQDTDFDSTPRRLGMGWAVKMAKPDFVGRHALARVDPLPLDRALVGLEIDGEPPLEGTVLHRDGAVVGHLTSCRRSHALGISIALGWVDVAEDGELPRAIVCDGRIARVVDLPFYDREGARLRG